jgi:hypothetical protein
VGVDEIDEPQFEPEDEAGRARRREHLRWLGEVNQAGGCLHPVRLYGQNLDMSTGEHFEGSVGVACKDRRASVCPRCALRYRGDAWHLIASGIRGGKGVPESVATHPMLFVTLTAPSFGPVHAALDGPCRLRRRALRCPHGMSVSCGVCHEPEDPVAGEPLCPACFDYRAAVLWNAHVGQLWDRTAALLRAGLAHRSGQSVRQARQAVCLSYVKVAEFQRRGLVHLHVVVRADGPEGAASEPPEWLDAAVLVDAVREAAGRARVHAPIGMPICWGNELDVTEIVVDHGADTGNDPSTIASYLAGYSTKSSESSGALARRIRSLDDLKRRKVRPHLAALVRTAWQLGADPSLEKLRLRVHAHTFGYRGHFATVSRAYSTTFSALRAVRVRHGRPPDVVVTGEWRYVGRGYRTPKSAQLAEVIDQMDAHRRAEMAARRRAVPQPKEPAPKPAGSA